MADSEEGADQVEVEVMDEVAGEEEEAEEGGMGMGAIIGIVVVVLLVVVIAALGIFFGTNMCGGGDKGTCEPNGDAMCKDQDNNASDPVKALTKDTTNTKEYCGKVTDKATCTDPLKIGKSDTGDKTALCCVWKAEEAKP